MSVRSIDAKVGYAPGERNYGDKRQMPELANDSAEEIDAPRPNLISSGHGGKSAVTPRRQRRNVDAKLRSSQVNADAAPSAAAERSPRAISPPPPEGYTGGGFECARYLAPEEWDVLGPDGAGRSVAIDRGQP